MTEEEVLGKLKDERMEFSVVEHKAVFTIQEMLEAGVPHPDLIAKNLFLRDDKKQKYYLVTVREDRKIDLKAFADAHGTRRLSFASEEDLSRILGLSKGAVTPLGLLSDEERKVVFFLDSYFRNRTIGVHPMVNTATVFMKAADLASLCLSHGNEMIWLD